MAIDGEHIDYNRLVTMELMPNHVEYCFNSKHYERTYK